MDDWTAASLGFVVGFVSALSLLTIVCAADVVWRLNRARRELRDLDDRDGTVGFLESCWEASV